MMSPLDLPEDQFLDLLGEALNQDVFSDAFKLGLLLLLKCKAAEKKNSTGSEARGK